MQRVAALASKPPGDTHTPAEETVAVAPQFRPLRAYIQPETLTAENTPLRWQDTPSTHTHTCTQAPPTPVCNAPKRAAFSSKPLLHYRGCVAAGGESAFWSPKTGPKC